MRPHDRQFLFRVPGSKTMFDFDELQGMNLPSATKLDVIGRNLNQRDIKRISLDAIIAKFG